MGVTVKDGQGYRVIDVEGILDTHTEESQNLQNILGAPESDIRSHHVINLAGVEYINSSMLGSIIRFFSVSEERGYRVILLQPAPSVKNVLDMTGLTQMLPVVMEESEVPDQLQQSRDLAVRADEVDYDALAEEIERIIRGNPTAGTGELGRFLGQE